MEKSASSETEERPTFLNMRFGGFGGAVDGHPFALNDRLQIRWLDHCPGTEFRYVQPNSSGVRGKFEVDYVDPVLAFAAERRVYEMFRKDLEAYLGNNARAELVLDYFEHRGQDMRGILLGRDPRSGDLKYDCGKKHVTTFGSSGYGKFVCNVAPTCLQYRGALFVIDPDGQAAAVTARARFERHGQIPYVLDPFGILRDKLKGKLPEHAVEVSYNPLREIDPASKGFAADARHLAAAMIVSVSEKDPIWQRGAVTLLRGMIMFVLTNPGERSRDLIAVREYLAATSEEWKDFIFPRMVDSPFSSIRNAARKLQSLPRNTFESVRFQCHADLDFLEDEIVEKALSDQGSNGFSFDELFSNALLPGVTEEDFAHFNVKLNGWPSKDDFLELLACGGVSLYIVTPLEYSDSHAGFLRLMTTLFLKKAMRRQRFGPPTLFILDEAGLIGEIEVLPTVYAGLRKHNVRAWTFWQDLGQVAETYPKKSSSIKGNAIQILLGTDQRETAEHFSKLKGMETKFVESAQTATETETRTYSEGKSGNTARTEGSNSSVSHADTRGSSSGQAGELGFFGWRYRGTWNDGTNRSFSDTHTTGASISTTTGETTTSSVAIGTSKSTSVTVSRVVEPYIRPEEILERLGEKSPELLYFIGGQPVEWCLKVRYFNEPMSRVADPDPWHVR